MTQVVYGQKGYLGSSMSVRAAEAYEQGEMPISRWTKTAIIQAVKDYCFDFDLAYDPDIENIRKQSSLRNFSSTNLGIIPAAPPARSSFSVSMKMPSAGVSSR